MEQESLIKSSSKFKTLMTKKIVAVKADFQQANQLATSPRNRDEIICHENLFNFHLNNFGVIIGKNKRNFNSHITVS